MHIFHTWQGLFLFTGNPSIFVQDAPQEAYGSRAQPAMPPGKPNHDDMGLDQQERPSSLPVSPRGATQHPGLWIWTELCGGFFPVKNSDTPSLREVFIFTGCPPLFFSSYFLFLLFYFIFLENIKRLKHVLKSVLESGFVKLLPR